MTGEKNLHFRAVRNLRLQSKASYFRAGRISNAKYRRIGFRQNDYGKAVPWDPKTGKKTLKCL